MRTAGNDALKTKIGYSCGKCTMAYYSYKYLVQHLFWRHGTESYWCNKCYHKRWQFATHICHFVPTESDSFYEEIHANFDSNESGPTRESDYCFCGKYVDDAPMIGCDGADCTLQWYHFSCVGLEEPPDGDWLCPTCTTLQSTKNVRDAREKTDPTM